MCLRNAFGFLFITKVYIGRSSNESSNKRTGQNDKILTVASVLKFAINYWWFPFKIQLEITTYVASAPPKEFELRI